MPVSPTRIPATARTCGSISLTPRASISSQSTPFALARSRILSSLLRSWSSVATITLPHLSRSTPCSSQKASSSELPRRHVAAFMDPGL
jgi:hypothetical protein